VAGVGSAGAAGRHRNREVAHRRAVLRLAWHPPGEPRSIYRAWHADRLAPAVKPDLRHPARLATRCGANAHSPASTSAASTGASAKGFHGPGSRTGTGRRATLASIRDRSASDGAS
jgi:hypothetical protein